MVINKFIGRVNLNTTFGKMNIPLAELVNTSGSNVTYDFSNGFNLYGDTFAGFTLSGGAPLGYNSLRGETGTICDIIGTNLHHTILCTLFNMTPGEKTIRVSNGDNMGAYFDILMMGYNNTSYNFGLPVLCTTAARDEFILAFMQTNKWWFTEGVTIPAAAGAFIPISMTATSAGSMTGSIIMMGDNALDAIGGGELIFPDPYNVIIPESSNAVPQGTGSLTTVDIPIPSPPTINICDTKFITLYSPTLAQLQALAAYMWSDSSFDIDNFQKLFADPMECILGLIMLPFTVPTSGNSNIQVGNMPTNVSANNVSAQYYQLSCGSITIDRFTGSYLDFEPYTKAQIFLPYIGIQDLSVDDIMGKTISVTYNIDILTGACIAFIKCGGSVLYQFIGQCGANIPITSNTYTGVIQSLLDLTRSLTHVAGGDMVGGLSGVASASVNINKPKIQKSGTLSGVGGFLGIQYPYIILTKPNPAIPKDQNKYLGYPSYVTKQVGSCSGFTQFETVYLEDMSCTESEKENILNLLKEGVIL